MKHPRASLLFALSLALAMGFEAFSSSGPPRPPANPTLAATDAARRGYVHWTLDRERSQLWLAHRGALEVYDTTGERLARLVTPDLKLVRALEYDAKRDHVSVATDGAVMHFALHAQFEASGEASRVIRRQS